MNLENRWIDDSHPAASYVWIANSASHHGLAFDCIAFAARKDYERKHAEKRLLRARFARRLLSGRVGGQQVEA